MLIGSEADSISADWKGCPACCAEEEEAAEESAKGMLGI